MKAVGTCGRIIGRAAALAVILAAGMAMAGAQELTTPTLIQRSYPEVEAVLGRVSGAWSASQSLRYQCELEYILKGTATEKRDHYRVNLRARRPNHLAVKAYSNGSVFALTYDGEFVFTHTKGNRFSKAPQTGDLAAMLGSGRLAAYPMILIELFAAESDKAFLNQFDAARVDKADAAGAMKVILTRRRETITITLTPSGPWLAPANVRHEWTFAPEVLEKTDKNLHLSAFENYTVVDAAAPIPIEEMSVQNVANELMTELGLFKADAPTTPALPAATPDRVKLRRESSNPADSAPAP